MTSPSGASPLRPQNQNLPMKEKQKHPPPSRWSGQRPYVLERACEKHLLELVTKG
jgi:hypothetical protein